MNKANPVTPEWDEGRFREALTAKKPAPESSESGKFKVNLSDVYEYTKWMWDADGNPQVPVYRCRFCFREATRPMPVEHAPDCPVEIIGVTP
jgi:hypothetical protein